MNLMEKRLNDYMDAGFPVLYLETFEEDKAMQMIKNSASNRPMIEWNFRGLFYHQRPEFNIEDASLSEVLKNFSNPKRMVNEKFAQKFNLSQKILVLKDVNFLLEQPEVSSKLKYLSEEITSGNWLKDCNIVIISNTAKIPKELEPYTTMLSIAYPTSEEIETLIVNFCNEHKVRIPSKEFLRELKLAFKGLLEFDIQNLLALSVVDDKKITQADLRLIHEQKEQMVKKSGIMEMIHVKETIDDIGGLENLKGWLSRKAKVINNIDVAEDYGVDKPKGVLIAGLPGCGKSLNAKAAAALFNVPLLRLDMGRLMGKYVGESEANLRKAISLAEAISPCILWIDELEKAFAGIGGQGGGAEVTTRLFGTFLTWMQEKEGMSFVVATANDITKLPPELLRKGRFDEIFYVGLPNAKEREKIFYIHISKRRPNDLKSIDITQLVQKTEGYSGADIEGVVKDAIETAFCQDMSGLTTELLINTINNTASLSEIMKDALQQMSETYKKNKFKNASILMNVK